MLPLTVYLPETMPEEPEETIVVHAAQTEDQSDESPPFSPTGFFDELKED